MEITFMEKNNNNPPPPPKTNKTQTKSNNKKPKKPYLAVYSVEPLYYREIKVLEVYIRGMASVQEVEFYYTSCYLGHIQVS